MFEHIKPGGERRLQINRRVLLLAIALMVAAGLGLASSVSWLLHAVGLVPAERLPVEVHYAPYQQGDLEGKRLEELLGPAQTPHPMPALEHAPEPVETDSAPEVTPAPTPQATPAPAP